MALKNVYINLIEFAAVVESTEVGLIKLMCRDYFMNMCKKFIYEGKDPKKLYVPKYPFYRSYSAQCIWFDDNSAQYLDYYNAHRSEIDEHTNLPLFTKNNTFQDFLDGRINLFLENIITDEYFLEHQNDLVVANRDRTNYHIWDTDFRFAIEEDEESGISRFYLKSPSTKFALGESFDDVAPTDIMQLLEDQLSCGKTTLYPFEWTEW